MIRTTLIFLSLLSTLLLAANDEIKPYTVTAPSGLSLRDGPGTDFDRISIIPFNETVLVNLSLVDYEQQDTVGEEMGTWYPVTYDGQEGYLFSSYLKYGHLFEPANVAENINHDYRIVIPGIRMGSLNYDPNLHWYGLYKSPNDEQSPLQIKKVNPQLDLDPFSIDEEVEYIDSGEDVSLDADVGDNYLLLMIGTRAAVTFDEIKTYYNDHYGEHNWGRPIYPNEQLLFWEASPSERYYLSGVQDVNYSELAGMEVLEYELGISKNASPGRYQDYLDQSVSRELYEIWEADEGVEKYTPTEYYYHPRLFWQGDVNDDGAPDLLFYLPDSSECCGGSESYYLLVSHKNGETWEWKRAANDILEFWGGC